MITIRSLLACFCSSFLFAGPLLAGTAKLTLTITSPKSGQALSNDAFTVTGTATVSGGISNVLCSLNQGAWIGADSANVWTNWSAGITNLVPGTNMFSAYAVADSGSRSPTNTVKFIYAVTQTLTVQTNGNGTIKPAYNGAQLLVGVNYSMTATRGKGTPTGFGFRNWTDGSNNIISTSATLHFTMASNLTLVANFGNILRPTVDVKNSTANADGYPADFIVHGITTDKTGVTNVFYQLNSEGWQTAMTTNNWTNWDASVSLQPGLNSFSVYAVNINSNSSPILVAQITYDSAPSSLSGKFAAVTDINGNGLFNAAFGKNIFSQVTQNTNNVNGVGSYTYLASGGSGTLKFKYTGPPSAASQGSQNIGLLFYTPTYAYFTNAAAKSGGFMQFSPVSNLAPANVIGQLIWSVGGAGNANGALYQKGKYTSQALLSGDTNGGNYTYTQYSPVGSLFKLTGTDGTSYVQASYADTNYGSYYEEDYDSAGHTNGMDYGTFIVAAQKPGGNAPLTVTNRNFQIFSGNDSFNVQFGPDTYSQDTLSTNFDNDVGNYTYTRPDTNIGQLNLTATAPPADGTNDVLAGSTSAARLIFVGGNVGLFTNDDGTISSFAMTAATNFAPASITNATLSLSTFYSMQFDTNGGFVYNAFISSYSGTYTYTTFSPGGAMLQLTYLDVSNNIIGLDWLQLNFKAAGAGNIFWDQFDADTNFLDNYGSSFSLY